ncbi:MAG: aspartate 1-decarboxylase [bacterium]|nr:aspartate 1-decarboxylase [bacterium]
MYINVLKSKIHRATVTEANLDYVGSITLDEDLMDAAEIIKNEKVQIADINNGNRLETYVIPGERGSGMICLNGAAARLVLPGDLIIIMSYALLNKEEAKEFEPKIVFVNKENKVIEIKNEEEYGQIKDYSCSKV